MKGGRTQRMSNTAERIKALRLEHKETQADLGNAIGVTPMAVSKYESGLSVPSDDTKVKLARHYNVSVEWLFFCPKVN
ncbi:helix-turn-helix transcriptional regulator [Lachnospiraceae bacterium Oil+RF-744-WCA-WT-13]|uniref:Helix-turn-helix transcriptional regulator n=2 Tax=Bilifractor porci TaxID=2606636 RepID=A0A7X2P6K0_9FIRM|nr:helix-turn-helix transcriptional regulator [Bilifractor porci]